MKLNIYENKKIIKTYEANTYDLMWGTLTDIIKTLKLDEMKTGSNEELLKMVLNLVTTSIDTIEYLMKDIFDGLTDDELKKTKSTEIANVLVDVVLYTFNKMMSGGSKN